MEKTADAFRTISEVADELELPQHVLRFWETRFAQIKPLKRGGGRRYYRREDIDLLRVIRQLLYGEGYTIKGVQKILKEQGMRGVLAAWHNEIETTTEAAGALVDVLYHKEERSDRTHTYDMEQAERDLSEIEEAVPALGRANYDALDELLTELDECERLLGTARAG